MFGFYLALIFSSNFSIRRAALTHTLSAIADIEEERRENKKDLKKKIVESLHMGPSQEITALGRVRTDTLFIFNNKQVIETSDPRI